MTTRRLPAEWEPQDAILLGWPHPDTDWKDSLEQIVPVFVEIARAITRFQSVIIPAPDTRIVENQLRQAGAVMDRVLLYPLKTDDTWARDFGPLTVQTESSLRLLDFSFNGWGNKFPAARDNRVTHRLAEAGCFGNTPLERIDMVLEGGSLESDGRGTLLTTARCLLEENRNPALTREKITETLLALLGAQRLLWLEHGHLEGDDTDAHIDTLVRMAPDNTLVFAQCDNPTDPHFDDLRTMEEELRKLRTLAEEPYRLLPLPWPSACYSEEGRRLPATYANYLILNDAVLVPTYRQPANDREALAVVQQAHPERQVIGIDCRPLIEQHGSLHCLTMQLPQGVLT